MEVDWKKAAILTGVASAVSAALYYLLQPANDEVSVDTAVPSPPSKPTVAPAPKQNMQENEPELNKEKLINVFNYMSTRLGERLVTSNLDTNQAQFHTKQKKILPC